VNQDIFNRPWRLNKLPVFLVGLLLVATAAQASPFTYIYTNWLTATGSTGTANGSVSGTLTIGAQTINVNYSGDVAFAQVGAGGTDYYIPASVYTNSQVANVPTNNNIIALSESRAFTDTLTFSSPLVNPILDIVSLGQPGDVVSYNFNATPVILSQGAGGVFGGCSTCLSVTGNSLHGTEGDGVIEFAGTFSSISWTTTNGEFWNGLTLGVQGVGAPGVPEPATWSTILLALGLAALVAWRRRKRVF
jgi:MYXO-CTERM domain-containing protein